MLTGNYNTVSPIPKVIGCSQIIKRFPPSPKISRWISPLEVFIIVVRGRFPPEPRIIPNPPSFHDGSTRYTFVANLLTFFPTVKKLFMTKWFVDEAILQLFFKTITVWVSASDSYGIHYAYKRQKPSNLSYYIPVNLELFNWLKRFNCII